MIFVIVTPMKNLFELTWHEAATDLSQKPRVGMHERQDTTITAMPHAVTMPAVMMMGLRMLPKLKMRQYRARIPYLTSTRDSVYVISPAKRCLL